MLGWFLCVDAVSETGSGQQCQGEVESLKMIDSSARQRLAYPICQFPGVDVCEAHDAAAPRQLPSPIEPHGFVSSLRDEICNKTRNLINQLILNHQPFCVVERKDRRLANQGHKIQFWSTRVTVQSNF